LVDKILNVIDALVGNDSVGIIILRRDIDFPAKLRIKQIFRLFVKKVVKGDISI
jgi:hypothetical protein